MKKDYPENRVEQIRDDAKFKFIFTDDNIDEVVNSTGAVSLRDINSQSPLYIMFTSGSTGRPKGVMIPRSSAENFYKWTDSNFPQVTNKDRALQVAEFTFDISMVDIGFFLNKNIGIYFSKFTSDIFRFAFEVETYEITCVTTVPNNLNMFLNPMVKSRTNYKSLKNLMIGGSRFSYGLYEKCLNSFDKTANIYNVYGPTESTVYSHGHKLTFDESVDCHEKNISIGTTLPGVGCRISDQNELWLSGNQLMTGYANREDLTTLAIVEFNGERFYKTGDITFQDEAGRFYITGRIDDTIKYRGYRIDLLDIDSYIQSLDIVEDSTTIAIPNELTDNKTIAFIRTNTEIKVSDLKEKLSKILLDYQIPEKIIFLDEYPVNNSGKVCKKTLKEKFLNKEYR